MALMSPSPSGSSLNWSNVTLFYLWEISGKSFINECTPVVPLGRCLDLVHFHRVRKFTHHTPSHAVCIHGYWEICMFWMGIWLQWQSSRGAQESPFSHVHQSQKLMSSIVRKNKSPNNWRRSPLHFHCQG